MRLRKIFLSRTINKSLYFSEKRFRSGEIDIETVVDLSETNEILYSDEQKVQLSFSKISRIKDFKKAFNLDIT